MKKVLLFLLLVISLFKVNAQIEKFRVASMSYRTWNCLTGNWDEYSPLTLSGMLLTTDYKKKSIVINNKPPKELSILKLYSSDNLPDGSKKTNAVCIDEKNRECQSSLIIYNKPTRINSTYIKAVFYITYNNFMGYRYFLEDSNQGLSVRD